MTEQDIVSRLREHFRLLGPDEQEVADMIKQHAPEADSSMVRKSFPQQEHEREEAADEIERLQAAAERLVREVYYFDTHRPEVCAIIRAANHLNDILPRGFKNERPFMDEELFVAQLAHDEPPS